MAKSNRMTIPAPTPSQKALKRVLTVSRLDGWSVMVVAGLGTLLTLVLGDWLGTGIGLLIGGAGWMEVHGHKILKRRDPAGMKWLIRSQLFLLALILAYCASRLGSFDEGTVLANLTPDMQAMLKEAGIEKADILPIVHLAFLVLYGGVAVVSLIYQGGMTLYYRSRVRLVTEALAVSPMPPSQSVF